jgi:toxin secretion/phage lysis holin
MEKIEQLFNSTVHICSSLANDYFLKCVGGLSLLLLEISFGGVGYITIICVYILIVIDNLTGVVGAKVSGEILSTRKFFNTVIKLVFFPMIIAASSVAERGSGISIGIPQLVAGYLLFHELFSIVENFGKMGFHIPQKILNRESITNFIAENQQKK